MCATSPCGLWPTANGNNNTAKHGARGVAGVVVVVVVVGGQVLCGGCRVRPGRGSDVVRRGGWCEYGVGMKGNCRRGAKGEEAGGV